MRDRLGLKLTAALAAIVCIWIGVVWALSYRYVTVAHAVHRSAAGRTLYAFESDSGRFALVRETQAITADPDPDAPAWQTAWSHTRAADDDARRAALYLHTLPDPDFPRIGTGGFGDDYTAGFAVRYHAPFALAAFIAVACLWRLLVSTPAGRVARPDDDPDSHSHALHAATDSDPDPP